MAEQNPLDELIAAWRRLGDESFTAVKRAFEAGGASAWASQAFGGAHGSTSSEPEPSAPNAGGTTPEDQSPMQAPATEGQPSATEPPAEPAGTSQPDPVLQALGDLRDAVESLGARLSRIEEALAELTLVGSDDDDDDDGGGDEADILRHLELHVKGLKKNKKGKKRK